MAIRIFIRVTSRMVSIEWRDLDRLGLRVSFKGGVVDGFYEVYSVGGQLLK